MLNIILCDDDCFIIKLTSEKITKLITQNHYDAQICCSTTESSDVLQFIRKIEGNYLVFLDLDFGHGKLNGIDIARNIKSVCAGAKVVFLTNHHEMAMKVLSSGVEPFGFIEKSTDMKKLSSGIANYIEMALQVFQPEQGQKDKIQLPVGIEEYVQIDKNQIIYLESEKSISHGISYHTMDGSTITVRDTMEHCQQQLGSTFVRIHRSILANSQCMVALSGSMVRMANGEEVPCSVRMRGEVKKCLK